MYGTTTVTSSTPSPYSSAAYSSVASTGTPGTPGTGLRHRRGGQGHRRGGSGQRRQGRRVGGSEPQVTLDEYLRDQGRVFVFVVLAGFVLACMGVFFAATAAETADNGSSAVIERDDSLIVEKHAVVMAVIAFLHVILAAALAAWLHYRVRNPRIYAPPPPPAPPKPISRPPSRNPARPSSSHLHRHASASGSHAPTSNPRLR